MLFKALVNRFRADEAGAVTVDWVVLTAAIIGLGFPLMYVVSSGANNLSSKISTQISQQTIATY